MSEHEEAGGVQPSDEVFLEAIRRSARSLSDAMLATELAATVARRDAFAAHDRPKSARVQNDVACVLAAERDERARARRLVEDWSNPVYSRPMTAEELAAFDDGGDA